MMHSSRSYTHTYGRTAAANS